MGNRLFLLFIFIQLLVIGLLSSKIIFKNQNTLGASVKTINVSSIIQEPEDGFDYFYEPKPNTIWSESRDEFPAEYSINKDSLNDRFNYPIEKPEDTYRIIAVGDSYTFGVYVNTSDNWTERLEDTLHAVCSKNRSYEVINLGVGGYDFAFETARYMKRGVKYSPDRIIWLVVDFERMSDQIEKEKRKIQEDFKKTNSNEEIEKIQKNSPYKFWYQAVNVVKSKISHEENVTYQKDKLDRFFAEYKGKVLFVLTTWISQENEEILKSYNTRGNVDVLRLPEAFKDLHFATDTHPNIEGHKFIANEVFKYLDKEKICK